MARNRVRDNGACEDAKALFVGTDPMLRSQRGPLVPFAGRELTIPQTALRATEVIE